MDLIDYIDAIGAYLRRDAHLFGEHSDIIYRVIRSGIKLMYTIGAVFIKRKTGFTLITGFTIFRYIGTIDGTGKNSEWNSLRWWKLKLAQPHR